MTSHPMATGRSLELGGEQPMDVSISQESREEKVHWIHLPDDRTVNIVFIHGVNGDYKDTWASWPRWVADDFPKAAVGSLSYAAATSRWRGQSMGLIDRAESVLGLFKNAHVFERPTLIIAHSFGGLVAKQLWRLVNDRVIEQQAKGALKGIIFIATPHHGSSLANFAQSLSRLFPTLPNPVTQDLRSNEPIAEDLHNWYQDHPIKYNWAFSETQKVLAFRWWPFGLSALVVDHASATPGIQDVHAEPIRANHIEICRPETRTNQIVESVQGHIREFINAVAKTSGNLSLTVIKGKEFLIQTSENSPPIRLPMQLPPLEAAYAKSAIANPKYWKRIHTLADETGDEN